MKKKLVIACQTCGYLLKDTANAYVDAGYEVTLMTSHYSWEGIKDTINPSIKPSFVITYNRDSSIKRIVTWFVCFIQMAFKIRLSYRNHEVLYVSNPPLAPLLPLWLHHSFSLLIWDIYPDVLVSQHMISKDSFISKWWKKSNRKVYQKAKHIYTLTNGMKECLARYVDEERIIVVPLWPDNTNLQHIDKSQNLFIKNNQLEGKFIVMYSGNLGNTHRVDVLVDVAKKIQDKDIIFVLIGEGGKKKIIEQRISDECVDNILMLPYQPYDFLSHSLSAADIAVITLDTQSSSMSVPSKTLNMLLLGTPLLCIASHKSELGNIVKNYSVGEIFEPEDVSGITDFVLKLKINDSVRNRYSENALNASRDFSPENAKMFLE